MRDEMYLGSVGTWYQIENDENDDSNKIIMTIIIIMLIIIVIVSMQVFLLENIH